MAIGGHSVSGIIDIKHNFHATVAPAVTDDITKEYDEGSQWVDETNNKSYVCVDNAAGAAVWQQTSGAGAVGLENVVEDTTPQLGGQLDVNGQALGDGTLELLKFVETGSAVNELTVTNAATGNAPKLSATGDDTNIDLSLVPKGTGALTTTTQAYTATSTLTDAATIDWNVSGAQVAKVTLAGNRTMAAPTNLKDGATYILHVIQDGTGTRTITWNAVFKWPSGTAPTLTTTAAARDILTFVSDGTNLYGVANLAFA